MLQLKFIPRLRTGKVHVQTLHCKMMERSPEQQALYGPSPESSLDALATLLFAVQDHFATQVCTELDPLQLDIEVDVTMDGRTVIKQARPFVSGIGP